jgi:hypothetical protein
MFEKNGKVHTVSPQEEPSYHERTQNTSLVKKSTIKIKVYDMFAEWTDLDSRTLL